MKFEYCESSSVMQKQIYGFVESCAGSIHCGRWRVCTTAEVKGYAIDSTRYLGILVFALIKTRCRKLHESKSKWKTSRANKKSSSLNTSIEIITLMRLTCAIKCSHTQTADGAHPSCRIIVGLYVRVASTRVCALSYHYCYHQQRRRRQHWHHLLFAFKSMFRRHNINTH